MSSIATVADITRHHGAARPGTTAILYDGRRITFGDLDARSSAVAQAFAADGVGAQDRVAFLDKNTPEYFEVLFGAAKLNAVTCAVSWRLAAAEAAVVVEDAEASVLVVGADFLSLLDEMGDALAGVRRIVVVGGDDVGDGDDDDARQPYERWIGRHRTDDPGTASAADDVALQLYSSGTTGRPKGVMLTNRNYFAAIEACNEAMAFRPDSVSHVVSPLFHVTGGWWALLGLYNGVPIVLKREVDPAGIVQDIVAHGITHTVMVPAVIQFVLNLPDIATADLSTLDLLLYGGSPIPETLLARAVRTFGCRFMQAYGMTETSGICCLLPPEDHDPDGRYAHRLAAAGLPVPGVELQVADPETGAEVPLGEVGEILVRSAQNMKGYWRDPAATSETIRPDGFLRTGDAGRLDEDGYLYVFDRVKDMIISGGENVYPAEVENVLLSHPAVADVAVIAVPHERWLETPKAVVVRAPGAEATEAELLAFTRERLSHFKCPTSVDFVASLPRNPSGKVLKKELRAPYWPERTR